MNGKYFGEIGQNIVIGELSKYGIGIAVPLGDNLPFDLIAIVDNRLYKLQIKSSSQGHENESVVFNFLSNDFYSGKIKKYSKDEVDVCVAVDLRTYQVYLFDDFEARGSVTIRLGPPKNHQAKRMNWHDDFVLNSSRVKKVFNFEPPNWDGWFSKRLSQATKYQHSCLCCGKLFSNGSKNAKYCGENCSKTAQRRVERPSKETLHEDINRLSWRAIGRKYGVSDNAVRKWARNYSLI